MVGRAFVMISFAGALSAGAYSAGADAALPLALGDPDTLTQATPLAQAKEMATQAGMQPDGLPGLWTLFVGTHNGSLGETSIIALLLGGLYLVLRRTASWEIPAGVILGTALLALVGDLVRGGDMWTVGLHVFSGSMIFGAFFIATDPVSSPLTPRGKFAFGLGVGLLIYVIRTFSGYPEGTMFAILLMNAVVPLINRATIPRPLGGRPQPAPAK
jgi:electron transport complex protein RnfD